MVSSPPPNGHAEQVMREASLPDAIAMRLEALDAGQAAMNGALGLMLDTLQVQTHLLRKLTEYAKEEVGPSPVAKAVGDLAGAVMEIDASVGALEKKFGELSEVIASAFDIALNRPLPPAPNGKMA